MRALLAITGLGAALRVFELGGRRFWFDEAVTVGLLRQDLGGMLETIPESEGAPPLYYVLAWGWARVFGASEAAVRSLLVVAGVATIPVVFLIARRLGGQRAGLIAAVLAAVSPALVWHAQDARVYAVWVLLGALSFLAFQRALERPDVRRLALWAAASVAALATHYFTAFLVIPCAVWLVARSGGAARRRAVAAGAAVAASGLALAPLAAAQSGHAGAFIEQVPLTERLMRAVAEPVLGYQVLRPVAAQVAVAAMALVTAVLAARALAAPSIDPALRRRLALPAALGAMAVVAPLLLVPVADWFATRNLLVAWPPLIAVAAVALAAVPGRGAAVLVGALAAVSITIVVATADQPKFGSDDWRTAFGALGPAPATGRAVVINPRWGESLFLVDRPRTGRPAGARVRVGEVAVVRVTPRVGSPGEDAAAAPRGRVPTPAGFRRVEERRGRHFTLTRFVATGAVTVDRALLARLASRPRPGAAVSVQPAGAK